MVLCPPVRARLVPALLLLAASACDAPASAPAPTPAPLPTAAPAPSAPAALRPPAPARDYEALARKLYEKVPGYEQQWPVEFHIRILEGLTQDLERELYDLGAGFGPPLTGPTVELAWGTEGARTPVWEGAVESKWTPGPAAKLPAAEAQRALALHLAQFEWLDYAQLKLKTGSIPAAGQFVGSASIDLSGRERGAGLRRDAGKVELKFERVQGTWQLTSLVLLELKSQRAPAPFFEERTEALIGGLSQPLQDALLRRSLSDDLVDEMLAGKSTDVRAPVFGGGTNAHPGLTVVDLDRDGFEDLFVWDVLGETTLLHNERGAGFTDATERWALRFRDAASATFLDLDSDGDLDLVLGRWASQSELYVQEAGRFYPHGGNRYYGFPANTVGVSAGDIDRDGSPDLYFATAGGDFHHRLSRILQDAEAKGPSFDVSRIPISPLELAYIRAALPVAAHDKALGRFSAAMYRFGPPNLFFHNFQGRHFVDETQSRGLVLFRDSLAATFTDLDGDGQPDLVVANDFAPSSLFFNRGAAFEDGSEASGLSRVIYGMGTSAADFDGDGDQDLYLTAMSSSAGARILADRGNLRADFAPEEIQARFDAARGNTLLRNDGKGHFTDATAEKPFAPARPAQWAYSAQFFDANADGWPDLFSPNGYYTARNPLADPYIRDL